ncbi:MAG: sulfotransferase domain-containing protein [Bacteroidetes bacterium]|nr:sulfotransferase domain-containing protein [Bacteroidota bacterium]
MTEIVIPDVIIGGAPKCGTTSLFDWLSSHPQVCASSKKETGFLLDDVFEFNRESNFINHGIEGYKSFFRECHSGKLLIEASPQYLSQKKIPKEFVRVIPENRIPKMVFILRKPSDRIYSQYRFDCFTRKILPPLNLKEYLSTSRGKYVVETTNYYSSLLFWKSIIGIDKIFLVIFEDLVKREKGVMEELSQFMGIDPGFWSEYTFFRSNRTVGVKNLTIHDWLIKGLNSKSFRMLKKYIRPIYYRLNGFSLPEKTPSDIEILEAINRSLYAEMVEILNEFNVDVSCWK